MADAQPLARTRTSIDFEALRGFLDALHSYNVDLVQNLRAGQTLCHYTSLEGALGIIQCDDLWLTNSRYSNDDEELRYGHQVVDEVLDERTKPGGENPWLRRLREALSADRVDDVFVCCFCEKENLLAQWRGYAENGGGISIEFDHEGFQYFAGPECPSGLMRLWKVFYEREQQKQIVRQCIDYPHWNAPNDEERIRFIVDAVQFFMPTFKNADFAGEEERRLIFTPDPNKPLKPLFRSRRGLLVPYLSLRQVTERGAAIRLPLKTVLIGPSANRALNVESTRMLLGACGRENIPVRASTTPFRG
jgi:hypothetical protein